MPSYVIKPDRDMDLYAGWSTVVDNLTWAGTRAEALVILARDIPHGYDPKPGNSPEDRIARCDSNGTTALWPETGGYFGGWDDDALMVEQRGMLPRADLARFVAALIDDDEDTAYALVRPFEDDL
jgi:hypothetical protein